MLDKVGLGRRHQYLCFGIGRARAWASILSVGLRLGLGHLYLSVGLSRAPILKCWAK